MESTGAHHGRRVRLSYNLSPTLCRLASQIPEYFQQREALSFEGERQRYLYRSYTKSPKIIEVVERKET